MLIFSCPSCAILYLQLLYASVFCDGEWDQLGVIHDTLCLELCCTSWIPPSKGAFFFFGHNLGYYLWHEIPKKCDKKSWNFIKFSTSRSSIHWCTPCNIQNWYNYERWSNLKVVFFFPNQDNSIVQYCKLW